MEGEAAAEEAPVVLDATGMVTVSELAPESTPELLTVSEPPPPPMTVVVETEEEEEAVEEEPAKKPVQVVLDFGELARQMVFGA